MERVLKRDIGPYKAGEIHDWPRPTWDMLAKKVGKKKTMWDITEPVGEAVKRGVEAEYGRA